MKMRFLILCALLFLTFTSGLALRAQTAPTAPDSNSDSNAKHDKGSTLRSKLLKPKPVPATNPVGLVSAGRKHMLDFRAQDEMSEEDRSLLLNAEVTIEERARFNDFAFNQGPWSLQQAVCPALPKHILVQFTRTGGKGDVSVFTAVIPRDPAGRIRIIPVERRGYSLFSPAPVNAITISTFNRIRDEEHASGLPDWLTLGLCYASMAGARPRADLVAENKESEQLPEGQPATVIFETDGTQRIEFVDMAALPHPMLWTMSFDKKARLLKAVHHPAILVKAGKQTQQIVDVPPAAPPQTTPK